MCVCAGSYPDRLIHGPYPPYWVPYRSERLRAAADHGLGTSEQLSLTDTQRLRHAGMSGPSGRERVGCVDSL